MNDHPVAHAGTLAAIWIKRAHRGVMESVQDAQLVTGRGIAGNVDRSRRRQVTLIEQEAWAHCMAELGAAVDPSKRRANLLVRNVRLIGARGRVLCIGQARLLVGGELTPCERMDEALAGLQAVMAPEWRGGVFAQVIADGIIRVGDPVAWEGTEATHARSGAPPA